MLRQLKIGDWLIEFDKELTAEYYKGFRLVSEDCSCANCRNFAAAYQLLSPQVLAVIEQFGIEPGKVNNLDQSTSLENGVQWYSGFYFFNGQILEKGAWLDLPDTEPPFSFSFVSFPVLVPDDFPPPILELTFSVFVPWVLSEPPI